MVNSPLSPGQDSPHRGADPSWGCLHTAMLMARKVPVNFVKLLQNKDQNALYFLIHFLVDIFHNENKFLPLNFNYSLALLSAQSDK